jgi:hypothetical protein
VIDITTEQPLALADAAKLIPAARGGKRCHLSTILRWIHKGSRGPNGTIVKLEAIRLGGRWLTTRQALLRFAEHLTPRMDDEPRQPPRGPEGRRRGSERAAAELEKFGL